MITIIAKRGIIALTTIFVGVLLTFVLFNIAPGDPCHTWAMQLVERQGIPYELAYKRAVEMWGYDPRKPIYQRFIEYIKGLLHGDLGYSRTYQMSTNRIIAKTLPWTVFVVSISLLLSFSLGIILGALIAWRRKGVLDSVVTGFASVMSATPAYLIALILLAFLGVRLKWFPVRGAYDITFTPGFNIPFILNCLYHGALPILSYVLEAVGGWTLAMKGSTISVLGEDYITAARARGLKERRIAISYAGRNSILP
nr:ABC transporter permease [Candidatus Bathyarchaeota archaeon]